MAKMTTMGVKLDEDTRTRLKTLGENRDRTPHWLMKKAITDFLDQEEALDIRNLEADAALKSYQETGEFVSHENMESWLKSWVQTRKVHVRNWKTKPCLVGYGKRGFSQASRLYSASQSSCGKASF